MGLTVKKSVDVEIEIDEEFILNNFSTEQLLELVQKSLGHKPVATTKATVAPSEAQKLTLAFLKSQTDKELAQALVDACKAKEYSFGKGNHDSKHEAYKIACKLLGIKNEWPQKS